jgi:FkbM family methyltransferase
MVRLFRGALRPGGLAVDVGAHLGLFSLIAAHAGSSVVAFEPNPRTLPHLRRNLQPVASRVEVVERAVAASEESRTFHVAPAGDTSSLVADADPNAVEAVTVRTVRADDVLAGRPVDAMKIDVEGAELEALAGLERTISASPDLKLFIECNPPALVAAGSSVDALGSRLDSLGLTVQTIDERAGGLRPGIDLGGEPYVNLYCCGRR